MLLSTNYKTGDPLAKQKIDSQEQRESEKQSLKKRIKRWSKMGGLFS